MLNLSDILGQPPCLIAKALKVQYIWRYEYDKDRHWWLT
jgi:hypothetical protein